MSPAPAPPGGVPWYDSLKFRAYVGSELLLIFGWLGENLTLHQFGFRSWTWIAVTLSTLTLCMAVVKDWMNPAVSAPFAILNKGNP